MATVATLHRHGFLFVRILKTDLKNKPNNKKNLVDCYKLHLFFLTRHYNMAQTEDRISRMIRSLQMFTKQELPCAFITKQEEALDKKIEKKKHELLEHVKNAPQIIPVDLQRDLERLEDEKEDLCKMRRTIMKMAFYTTRDVYNQDAAAESRIDVPPLPVQPAI